MEGNCVKKTTFVDTVLIYHLSWSKMQSQRPKCSLFHECPLKKITLVLYLGIPEGQNRCQVTLNQFLSLLVFAQWRIDDTYSNSSHEIKHILTFLLIS